MRKLALILSIFGITLFSNPMHAQQPRTGEASKASTTQAETSFAWGIGLGGLVVMSTVIGIIAASPHCCKSSH